MKKLLVLLIVAFFAIVGCSTFGKVVEGPPDKAKETFDELCSSAFGTATENNSNFDFYIGGFAGVAP